MQVEMRCIELKNFENPLNEELVEILLADRTTGKNIIWATDNEKKTQQISIDDVRNIEPRYKKNRDEQKFRTRQKGEIFTPPNICEQQNNLIDADSTNFENYITYTVLEITCGEAPYLVSRYDTTTGEQIEIEKRVGMLDRKFRVVSKNCNDKESWERWAKKAVQSVYGYELQGDNLFLARQNIFLTYVEHYEKIFHVTPAVDTLKEIAEIISWNLWQMDGLTNAVPYFENSTEVALFDKKVYCKIKDWANNKPIEFRDCLST